MHCKVCGDWTCEKLNDVHHLVAYATEEDEDGHFHYHDRNGRWQEWKCSKGHVFRCCAFNHCWCGWSSQYPEKCDYKFKPHPPTKGVKFGNVVRLLTNKEWITNIKLSQESGDELA